MSKIFKLLAKINNAIGFGVKPSQITKQTSLKTNIDETNLWY